jgi:parallel beta-helix repeat protein
MEQLPALAIWPCADCDTTAKYGPPDSDCRDGWNANQGPVVDINTSDHACDLFEVCDPSLDYIVEDALECCENEDYISAISGDRLSGRRDACRWAHRAYGDNFRDNYDPINLKKCVGRYIIKGIGDSAVYMQGYFRGEFCCNGSDTFCGEKAPDCPYWQTKPAAWEMGKIDSCTHRVEERPDFEMGGHRCESNYFLWWEWGEPGYWSSDTNYLSNNDSVVDLPAHASINKISSGTCVDYAIATATALRKAGYGEDEVYAVDGDGHDYNLVKFPDYAKWYYVDTTGNRGTIKGNPNKHCCKGIPASCDLITSEDPCDRAEGCSWSGTICIGTPEEGACRDAYDDDDEAGCLATSGCTWEVCNYAYCRALDQGCYNDNLAPSQANCPPNDEIHGCEGVEITGQRTISFSKTSPSEARVPAVSRISEKDAAIAPLAIDGECSELNPCTRENIEEAVIQPTSARLTVTKSLNDTAIPLGDQVQVKIRITNSEKLSVLVTVQENFIPEVNYIDLDPQVDWYEGLQIFYYTWKLVIAPGETKTVIFNVEPRSLGSHTLAPTLIAAGSVILKATCGSIEVGCIPNGLCEPGENSYYCRDDCPSGGMDGYCDRIADGINDPDCQYGVDPDFNEKADTDGDSVLDMDDLCPLTKKYANVDSQGCACYQKSCNDGNDLTIDSCSNSTVECSHVYDFDKDGIPNVKDNCVWGYNPDQIDSDGDGKGDQCEIPLITRDTTLEKGTYYINTVNMIFNAAIAFGNSAINATLDCNGSRIIGIGAGYGIYVPPGYGPVTIKNCYIENYEYGIFLDNTIANQLLGNTVRNNSSGIVLGASLVNTLDKNVALNNTHAGISLLSGSDKNTVINNSMTSNGAGILLQTSLNNTVSSNYVCQNVNTDFYEYSSINTGTSNTCDTPDGWNDDFTIGCTKKCFDISCSGDFHCDRDVDGADLAHHARGGTGVALSDIAEDFGRIDCPVCVR